MECEVVGSNPLTLTLTRPCAEAIRAADPEGTHPIATYERTFHFRNHLAIVFEPLGRCIADMLESPRGKQGLSLDTLRPMAKDLLDALAFLHSLGIIHCDIKPENLLIKPGEEERGSQPRLRVIDFNTSTTIEADYFLYIQTRYYRSPEAN